jgi:hypothetical protein
VTTNYTFDDQNDSLPKSGPAKGKATKALDLALQQKRNYYTIKPYMHTYIQKKKPHT